MSNLSQTPLSSVNVNDPAFIDTLDEPVYQTFVGWMEAWMLARTRMIFNRIYKERAYQDVECIWVDGFENNSAFEWMDKRIIDWESERQK